MCKPLRSPTPWLLMCALALSSCATSLPKPAPGVCPLLPPVPAPLMQPLPPPLHSAQQIRSLLFKSVMPLTPESSSSGSR